MANTELDDVLVPAVQELLDDLGRDVIFTVADVSSTYDASTGESTKSTNNYTVKATPPYPYSDRMISSGIVQMGDMRMLVAAEDLDFTPTPGDLVTWDSGDVWRTIQVSPIYSGELICAWELQLRK